ncbi:hypothetical protein ACQPZJ_15070 [Actinoplanes sp. CA-054009]
MTVKRLPPAARRERILATTLFARNGFAATGLVRAAASRSPRSSPIRPWARWAAQLAPAGQPDPALAAERVRHVIAGVITAATVHTGRASRPPTA